MYSKDKTVIIDRREMLRVKAKSLAAEAVIIRREEKRTFGDLRNKLHLHRVGVVRHEARHTYLAYGLIRGTPYEAMEATCITPPDWAKVRKLIAKYGPKGFAEPACMQPHAPVVVAPASVPKAGFIERLFKAA